MSSAAAIDATQAPNPAGSKKKNNKKKKNANKNKDNTSTDDGKPHGDHEDDGDDNDEDEQDHSNDEAATKPVNGHVANSSQSGDAQGQGALQAEVEQLRKQLEIIQQTHKTEIEQLQAELEESNTAKETAEEQYQTLLERRAGGGQGANRGAGDTK
ncbi:hypothetical protein NLG97_g9482 [Lecanicillium saksenae]|uniref:Uncharacterized protein n=1 Tax=Lecanicillium saksenae TaxID=468837 RepID=A0ACC1QHD3_9HYPO|nr:hypothetical protein NLG97_g9482 [Lecanicillium saksenae]